MIEPPSKRKKVERDDIAISASFTPGSYVTKIPILKQKGYRTYVIASLDGKVTIPFPCGGGTDGLSLPTVVNQSGHKINTPCNGNLEHAQMIACKDCKCDIIWGSSGTCHQMANRVMWCCDDHPILPIELGGVEASYSIFGIYGGGMDLQEWTDFVRRTYKIEG